MSNRKEITEWYIKMIDEIHHGNSNVKMYQEHFAELSDEAFDSLMPKLASGEEVLPYISPNLSSEDIDLHNALKVADKLGLDFFQQLWLIDPVSGVKYLTPQKYIVLDLPIRRQSQHVSKGKSVTEDSSHIDVLTGQPVTDSKTSRMSLPEVTTLESLGLHKSLKELLGPRGGHEEGFKLSKRQMMNTGTFSLAQTEALGSRATSTETLRALLLGMHFETNV